MKDWQLNKNLNLVHLKYDLTPSEYITMIVCEIGRVPAISVPVVIRETSKEFEELIKDPETLSDTDE